MAGSPTLTSTPPATTRQPLFEPTDLLNFDFPVLPPSQDGPVKIGNDEQSMEVENQAYPSSYHSSLGLNKPISQSRSMAMEMDFGSPPPDFEEEPSDLEDEMALMEMEREAAGLAESTHPRSTQNPSQNPKQERSSSMVGDGNGDAHRRKGGNEFISSGILELADELLGSDTAIASSSRVPYGSGLHFDVDFEPLPLLEPLYSSSSLPPLRAETASGGSIDFKRRTKRAPPSAQVLAQRGAKTNAGDLLSVPLHRLLAEVDELKSQQKAIQIQQSFELERRQAAMDGRIIASSSKATTMWVDKYRPQKFTDLLGEDRVHREVMGWLKEWDKCVFKRATQVKKRRTEEPEGYVVDPLGRPRERILLLSGPPGYGKTTLAHIVARHAGYRTLEINASDDRSAATVSTRIKNAIDAGTGLASEGRPTCVVIDEIDGASGGGDASFVRSLIKLIQDVPARKKTNTPAKPLRRPIICICNDLYATSLRPLRPFARIIRFRKPQAQFLVKRLRDICDRETLSADLRTLTMLVDVTSGDVRSCLNTLQFIKSRSSTVSEESIRSSSVGLKDSGTTLPSTWASLFIPLAAKQRRKAIGIDDGRYVDRLAFSIQACGEYDKLVQGLFEHYPNLKPLDASLGNLVKVHDWLGYYDRLATRVGEAQEFELMGYMPYAIVPWYSHLAAPANNAKPTEWPKADYESFVTRSANEETATQLKAQLPGILRSLFSPTTTLTELIPLLMRIISPPLKPVGANIVKPAEKAVLVRLVDLMIPLGLKFWQEKGENGQPMMRLEPPIDVFVHYEGRRADDIAASRFAVRQLVAQAMDAEIARRKGAAGADGAGGSAGGAQGLAKAYGLKGASNVVVIPDKPEVAATDFFGRPVVPKSKPIVLSTSSATATATDNDGIDGGTFDHDHDQRPKKKFRAVYKFNEGSSSAVRKTIKMSALM